MNEPDEIPYIDNIKLHDDYFHISSKLERKLKLKFNPSQSKIPKKFHSFDLDPLINNTTINHNNSSIQSY
jgi:hypothetical protein